MPVDCLLIKYTYDIIAQEKTSDTESGIYWIM